MRKNLTSLIEYYKSLNLDDYRETNILAVGNLEKFVGKDIYNRSFFCKKLLNLEKELHCCAPGILVHPCAR